MANSKITEVSYRCNEEMLYTTNEIADALNRAHTRMEEHPESFWGLWENFLYELDDSLMDQSNSDDPLIEEVHSAYRKAKISMEV
jgi:transcription elongation factor GreA-like protein